MSTKAKSPKHKVVSREEWTAARKELLKAEKEHTRRGDELAKWRQELPWVRIDKNYRFDTEEGTVSLADLFKGRSQLLVYHLMFGPDFDAPCPSCSSIADGFNGIAVHLANHDVMLCAVSRAPIAKLKACKQRMGWSFPWASSFNTDFNYDFHVSHTREQQASGALEYNFRSNDMSSVLDPAAQNSWITQMMTGTGTRVGTDWATFRQESPGLSAFVLEDGVVYHTYSAYARGLDGLWGMYQWLDRAPFGRNEEDGIWWRRHDEYDQPAASGGSCCHTTEARA